MDVRAVSFVSFVTCVRDSLKYADCRRSIERQAGAAEEIAVEAIAIDNARGEASSAQALEAGRARARGDVVVFCHEDVTFPDGWVAGLVEAIEDLDRRDPGWGVLGPMGRRGKRFLGRGEDAEGRLAEFGPLPAEVDTLDEFCFVVRAGFPLHLDERLGGHHLYAVDLCIQAHEAGYGCWAADLCCRHGSSTRHRPPEYHRIKRRLQRKWMFRRRRVGRSVGTTCGRIRFGPLEGWL